MKHFLKHTDLDVAQIAFALGADRNGKVTVIMTYQPGGGDVAIVTAPAITMWPRCSGDGNFGTMWGPSDVTKAKFTLDLGDAPINDQPNTEFEAFKARYHKTYQTNAAEEARCSVFAENQVIIAAMNADDHDEAVYGVGDRARTEEQVRLEEGVGEEVEDRRRPGADTEGHRHVPEL